MCVSVIDLRSCRFIAFLRSVIRVSILLDVWPIYFLTVSPEYHVNCIFCFSCGCFVFVFCEL